MIFIGSKKEKSCDIRQSLSFVSAFYVFVFFLALSISACSTPETQVRSEATSKSETQIRSEAAAKSDNRKVINSVFVSKKDMDLPIEFNGLSKEESARLEDKEINYFIFVRVTKSSGFLYPWGYLREDTNNRFVGWHKLRMNDTKEELSGPKDDSCNLMIPEAYSDNLEGEFVILFSRGKKTKSHYLFVPDETTEYACCTVSKKDIERLVHRRLFSNDYISYKDLKLDFKSEEQMVRDDELFKLVAMSFDKYDPRRHSDFDKIIMEDPLPEVYDRWLYMDRLKKLRSRIKKD